MIYHEFTETFLPMLYEQTPKKQKFTKANNSNFETKKFKKSHYESSKLRNKYFSERRNEAKSPFNNQRTLYVIILHKNKIDYFGNINN